MALCFLRSGDGFRVEVGVAVSARLHGGRTDPAHRPDLRTDGPVRQAARELPVLLEPARGTRREFPIC